jgi:hypothetical protein
MPVIMLRVSVAMKDLLNQTERDPYPWPECSVKLIIRLGTYPRLDSLTERGSGSPRWSTTYSWQTVERKARFIGQFMSGRLDAREIEDIGEMTLARLACLADSPTGLE